MKLDAKTIVATIAIAVVANLVTDYIRRRLGTT